MEINNEHYQAYIAPLIEGCEEKECHQYWSITRKLMQEETDDQTKKETLALFDAVVSYMLAPDSPAEPFKPVWIMDGRRSPIPDDLTEEQREFLQQVLPEIADNELRARVADTLWTLRYGKARQHAEVAIEAYLTSANILLERSWHDTWERLTRAFRIFQQLRLFDTDVPPEKNAPQKILDYIEAEKDTAPPYLVLHLIELLYEARRADNERHAAILESIATAHEEKNHYDTARDAWNLAAKLHQHADKVDDAIRCQVNGAETYVKLADIAEAGEQPSYMLICGWLQSAVEAYRSIPGKQQRRDEIYERLLEGQPKIKNEMQSFSTEVDVSDIVKKATEEVSGHDLFTALYKFAFLMRPPPLDEVKEEMEEQARKSPLSAMMSATYHDRKGRVVAKSSMDDSPESKMHRHIAQFHRNFFAKSALMPALQQIRLEHNISLFEWVSFLKDHPFVPPERVNAYAYGFFHGFHGDFLSAAHILIPQIENSIRYVLNNYERQTSRQIAGGIQEESSLNYTLEDSADCVQILTELFGKDLVFDLQGLLIKKEGENMRNNLMHGLLDDDQLFAPEFVYLYWLALHIIFIPVKNMARKSQKAETASATE